MRGPRSRRIETTPAVRTRGATPNTRLQVVGVARSRRRRTRNDHCEQPAARAMETGPSSGVNEGTAMDLANDQSNPVETAGHPVPDAANNQSGAGEDMGGANGQSNPVVAADELRKQILYLRYKLQKGLLSRDQEPKEDEMNEVSDYLRMLEGYADLDVGILRATKINKVLKAILKLTFIPMEDTFQFKRRSQTLHDKWKELLEQSTPATIPAGGDDDAAMDIANNQSGLVEAAANGPTTIATSSAGPIETPGNESAMAAATGDEDVLMGQPDPVEAADDSATNEIEDDDDDEEMPTYIWNFFHLEDMEDLDYSGNNLDSDNIPSRTFRLRDQLDQHYQKRDLHVEHVSTILDRVVAQVQGRNGELDEPRDSLESFLRSELDATGVTVAILNWLITKQIPKYRMQLGRSLRQVKQDRAQISNSK